MGYPVLNTKKELLGNGEMASDDEGKRVLFVMPESGKEYIVPIELVEMKIDLLTLFGPRTYFEVK